jgi:hypothetical protein
MPALIALRAAFGQDELNHGTARYRVSVNGLVNVPPEVALYLIKNGGFAVAAEDEDRDAKRRLSALQSDSLVPLHHGAVVACSYAGVQYRADKNGDFMMPVQAVADLMAHGFVPVTPRENPQSAARSTTTIKPPEDPRSVGS